MTYPSAPHTLLLAIAALACLSAAHAAPTAFAPEAALWHTNLAVGRQMALTGDFDGDGKHDLAVFVRDTEPAPQAGRAYVALSDGSAFRGPNLWHTSLGTNGETPIIGDFDGNGKDDVALAHRSNDKTMVALSDGTRFADPVEWHNGWPMGAMTFLAGDVNGDRKDDLVCFVKDSRPAPERGNVHCLLSTGRIFRPQVERWHEFFCVGVEVPLVADFTGDGRADLGTWVDRAGGAWNPGYMYVAPARATANGFDRSAVWATGTSQGNEIPITADANGDRKADLLLFSRGEPSSPTVGDVRVSLSTGRNLAAPALWHAYFCVGQEQPLAADFTGDRSSDIATLIRETVTEPRRGDVLVSAAQSQETPRVVTRVLQLNRGQCLRKNEGGDEWVYFATLGFRVTPGVGGSAQVTWSGAITPANISAVNSSFLVGPQGRAEFPNLHPLTPAEVARGRQPELFGAAIILIERDDTGAREAEIRTVATHFQRQLAAGVETLRSPSLQAALEAVGVAYRTAIVDDTIIIDEFLTNDDDVIGRLLWVAAALKPPQTGASVPLAYWVGTSVREASGMAQFGRMDSDDGCYQADWTLR